MATFGAGLKRPRDESNAPDLSNDYFSVRAPSSGESVLVFRGKAGKERLWNSFDRQGGVIDYNADGSKAMYTRPDGREQHFKGGKAVEYKTKTVHPDGTEVFFAGHKRTQEKKRLVIKPDTGVQTYFSGHKGAEAKRITYHQPGQFLPEHMINVFRGQPNQETRAFSVGPSCNILHYQQLECGHDWVSAITTPSDGSTTYYARPGDGVVLPSDGGVLRKVAFDGTPINSNGTKQAYEKLELSFKEMMEKMLELKEANHCNENAVLEMGKLFKDAHQWAHAYQTLAEGGGPHAVA